jgi:uncharacterized membrane protein YesL
MGFSASWRLFVQALKTSYDHIGKVMLFNLIWFAMGFAPILVMTYLPVNSDIFFAACLITTFITLGGATAAIHYVMSRIISGEDTSVRDFWNGFKQFFARGGVILFLAILGFTILVFNIWFSGNYPNTVFLILAGFWVWGIIYWYAMLQFVFPFLTQQNVGVFLSLKRAALITLDNPLASGILLVLGLVVIVLSAVLAAPILIFTASFLALLQNYFYNELMLKYDTIETEEELPEVE